MANVAIVETKPSRTNYKQEFDNAFEFDRFALCSDPTVKKVLKKNVDIEFDPDNYEWVILVGADACKYYTKNASVTDYSGKIVDEKFLPVINPAMISFKPESKRLWEESQKSIIGYITGAKKVVKYKTDKIYGIRDSEKLHEFLRAAIASPNGFIGLDSETSALAPRDGYVLGVSLSYERDHGAYIDSDCIDDLANELFQELFDKKVVVFHNAKFDLKFMKYHFGWNFPRYEDTMLLHYCLDENPGTHGLKQLALQYTDYGDYEQPMYEWIEDYLKRTGTKKDDFSFESIPFEVIQPYACLTHDSQVYMEDGSLKTIGELVRSRSTERVLSYNQITKKIEPKEIEGWIKEPHKSKEWLQLVVGVGSQVANGARTGPKYTPDHKVFLERGWTQVKDVVVGDRILSQELDLTEDGYQVLYGSLLGDGRFDCRHGKGAGIMISQAKSRKEYASFKASMLGADKLSIKKDTSRGNRSDLYVYYSEYNLLYTDLYHSFVTRAGTASCKPEITENFVSKLDIRAIAIWYMDDGNLTNDNAPRIWTRTMKDCERSVMLDKLESLGLKGARWYEDEAKNNQFFTWDAEYRDNFFNLINPYIHEDCQYKVPEAYNYGPKYKWNKNRTNYYFSSIYEILTWTPPLSRRGYSTKWCINVKDNHNFFTKTGLVHNCIDSIVTFLLYLKLKPAVQKNKKLDKLYNNILLPACSFLIDIEENGVPFDLERLKFAQIEMQKSIDESVEELYRDPRISKFEDYQGKEFNPNSVMQLRSLLFDFIGIQPTGKKTGTGANSTDAEVLQELAEEHEVPKLILNIRQKSKIKNTYLDKIIPNLDRDSRLRTNFNLHGTTSGRLSSSGKLNMQQLPRDNPAVKGCIKARPGYKIVSVDLTTAEVYIAAVLSGDKELMGVFTGGGDFHSTIAKKVFNLPCEVSEVKALFPLLRQAAKAITFGILYGSGANKVSETVNKEAKANGMDYVFTVQDAQEAIKAYFKQFKDLKNWLTKNQEFISSNGYAYSHFGRKRRLPNVLSTDGGVKGHAVRSGINFLIQSTASDVNLLAAIDMHEYIKNTGMDAKIFALVHDSILAEVREDLVDLYTKKLTAFIQADRGVSIPGYAIGCDFDLGMDYSFGKFEEYYGLL